jgi:hypothetical protein
MRIYSPPAVVVWNKNAPESQTAPACRGGNVLACAKFLEHAHFFHIAVLLMPFHPPRLSTMPMLQNCCAVMALLRKIQNRDGNSTARNVAA